MPQPDPANGQQFRGLELTVKLMEKYRLLLECARHQTPTITQSGASDSCSILESLRCSRDATADLLEEVQQTLEAVQVAAEAGGYGYKVDAFIQRYVKGETYEDIADSLSCGRNSPARWCKEIMEEMAIRLFGINGIV